MRRHESRTTFTSRPTGNTDYADITRTLGLKKEQACRLLPALVGRMCLEIYDREWVPELPFLLWEKVADEKGNGSGVFRGEEVALFRLLAQVADGWVCHDRAEGLKFVRRSRWLRAHAAWKRTARPRARKAEAERVVPNALFAPKTSGFRRRVQRVGDNAFHLGDREVAAPFLKRALSAQTLSSRR